MEIKRKWKGKTGGSLIGQQSLLAILKIFDIRIGYALMAAVVPIYMLIHHNACRSIYRYFRRQFGHAPLQAVRMTYKNHYAFGQTILDRFAVFSGHKDRFEVTVIGNEHFVRLTEGRKGFIIAGAHIGNFEIAGYLLRQYHKKINALFYAGETRTVQNNRRRILAQNNIRLIPVTSDMSHIFSIHAALRSGEIVSMPCDRNWGSAKTIRCRFMNGTAHFPVGAFALAATFDVEMLSIFVLKQSARRYVVHVRPIAIPAVSENKRYAIEAAARNFVSEMENILRQYPEQWFNYYDFFDTDSANENKEIVQQINSASKRKKTS
ncbi:MAG: lipid A biosynthesis (KDO)2-(lauroyl)-lipid IVA acyltransferase [Tannerellaceae bacterium]|jgi:predicted LPLAT superfamily acyltransferase|nr:lipid A biosynthesis (KDO)2-(lauroyl)-lipid IVA acyltransferase [Tannerellaceae bacterium]